LFVCLFVCLSRIEWATFPDFRDMVFYDFLTVSGGAPFRYEINGLVRGTTYWVRVKARNSQGFGGYQVSTPTSEYPRELPSAPTKVRLLSTSGRVGDGKLTVAWDSPATNGGDEVTHYVIRWDIYQQFNSLNVLPEKGEVVVARADTSSHTISGLVPGKGYWVTVGARNKVGTRFLSAPLAAVPALRKCAIVLAAQPCWLCSLLVALSVCCSRNSWQAVLCEPGRTSDLSVHIVHRCDVEPALGAFPWRVLLWWWHGIHWGERVSSHYGPGHGGGRWRSHYNVHH
jgi:hypothetical protein